VTATITRVVVVGGGSVTWLAAAGLRRAFGKRGVDVLVVETGLPADSPAGRWTLPSQRGMHGLLGIPEAELVRRTGASFKLATEHVGWQGEGSRFFHAHGDIGTEVGDAPFYKYLVLQALKGRLEAPENYSLAAVAARIGRFARPTGDEKALTSSFTYGFHLDEPAYVAFLAAHAAQLGVRRVSAPLAAVTRLPGGEVAALRLANGEQVPGDLFLDCSGAESLLMRELGPDAREDWSAWLPCDRMISVRAAFLPELPPFTRTVATDAGWAWRLPLARASVAGYVYNSAHASDEAALRYLQSVVPGVEIPGRVVSLASGRRRQFWEKNCIALGASAMQLEPLAGADLHFAQLGLGTLIELFPLDVAGAIEGAEYNRVMTEHADALRDFTLAHYRAGRGRPGGFWSQLRAVPLPQRLADKLDLFQSSARINLLDFETFEEVDWAWLLLGARVIPAALELQIRARVEAVTEQQLVPLRAHIDGLAASMPRHSEYLQRSTGSHAATH
jgi:tryptophan 7-halogenase